MQSEISGVTARDTSGIASRLEPFSEVAQEVIQELDRLRRSPFPTFIFLTGINGSGKTTFKLKFLDDLPFVSYDTIVHPLLKDRKDSEEYIKDINLEIVDQMEQKLRAHLDQLEPMVVFEEASIGLSLYRAHFIYLARLHGYRVVLLYFPLDKATAHARNRKRSLGMSKDGQIRLPEVIVETLDTYKNTEFRTSFRVTDHDLDSDVAAVPTLVAQLSQQEQAVVNEAFFRFPTLTPQDAGFCGHLKQHDVFDEIWRLDRGSLYITT